MAHHKLPEQLAQIEVSTPRGGELSQLVDFMLESSEDPDWNYDRVAVIEQGINHNTEKLLEMNLRTWEIERKCKGIDKELNFLGKNLRGLV